jgi:antitoxin component YwqK of YwqJK toxin-antitoxin module
MSASLVLAAVLSSFVPTCSPSPEVRPGPGVRTVESIDGRRVAAQGRERFGERHGRWCHYGDSGHLIIEEHRRLGELHGPRILFGRTRTERMYDQGHVHGTSRTLRDGVIVSEGWVEHGQKSGPWIEPDMLGPRAEGDYVDGRRSGPWTIRLRSGGLLHVEYRAGLYHGPSRESDANQGLVVQQTWVDARVLGPARLREPDGSFAAGQLNGERREGRWTFEGADGKPLGTGEYRRGERHGTWRTRVGDGWTEGQWTDGQRDGVFTQTDAAGQVLMREGWHLGTKHGVFETFDSGQRRSLQTWRDGAAHGPWGVWDGAGVVRAGSYEDSLLDGPWVERASIDGVTGAWTGVYLAGARAGVWTFDAGGTRRAEQVRVGADVLERHWSADGVLVSECERSSGRLHGRCARWYDDGTPRSEQTWAEGLADGVLRRWGPAGVLLEESSWAAGQREGRSRLWHDDGTLREDSSFVADAYDGVLQQWSEDGVPLHRGSYRAGQPVGVQQAFHDDGRLARRCSFDDEGQQHGRCEQWFTTGARYERAEYEHGLLSGGFTRWWPSGVRRQVGDHLDGQRDGSWRVWYPGGALAKEGEYLAGLKTGQWTFFDPTGRAIRWAIYSDGIAVAVKDRGGTWGTPSGLLGLGLDPDPDRDPEERRPVAPSGPLRALGALR